MNKRIMLVWLLAVLAAVIGCAQSLEQKAVGKYKMNVDLSAMSADMKSLAESQMKNMKTMTLELKSDKTLEMVMGENKTSGNWKVDKEMIVLSPSAGTGQPMNLKMSSDGKTLTPTDDASAGMMGAKLSFTKT